ncbi:DUF1801 domain-containing protein [Bogoriella caseilytica]|uniref:YdhG-like domain-containing protein n=1 Tax=Bogoriella caseilytica TaxID=56055 RepID=A0A3N2BFU5_9MICO|nr:DUF1801 domain-containing protein [Bogoriella caseilytica]ROR74139.1 hypothetical protein EDD31_2539 [Bogoriella caseilytica]
MRSTDTRESGAGGFSEQERAAMKVRAAELKEEASRGRGSKKASAELDVLSTIAAMDPADRTVAERIHVIVTSNASDLAPKLWYGQPAYATQKGKVVCFFRSGQVDKERYSTFGFTTEARLDDATGLWATSFAITELTDDAERAISDLVKKAVA